MSNWNIVDTKLDSLTLDDTVIPRPSYMSRSEFENFCRLVTGSDEGYEKGYEDGYDAGQETKEEELEYQYKLGYNAGLHDA